MGHASVAEDEPDQIGEARLGANIVRQDHDATPTCLDADHSVGGLAVVAALVEAVALRAVEDGDALALMCTSLPLYQIPMNPDSDLCGAYADCSSSLAGAAPAVPIYNWRAPRSYPKA